MGIASDLLKPAYGQESLRYALMFTSVINIWAGAHFMLAGSAYAREMRQRKLDAESAAPEAIPFAG